MDALTPPGLTRNQLNALAVELKTLRDMLVKLSLLLSDYQFESNPALRAAAQAQTDQLLQVYKKSMG